MWLPRPERPGRRRARRAAAALAALTALAAAPAVRGDAAPDDPVAALRARLARAAEVPEVDRHPDALAGPIAQARRALEAHDARRAAGDAPAARRALAIARAHLALVERRIARLRAARTLEDARQERSRATSRAVELARRLGVDDPPPPRGPVGD